MRRLARGAAYTRLGLEARRMATEGHRHRAGVSPSAVSQWRKRAQPPLLLAKGAEVYDYHGDVWTARRVAQFIADTFSVRYHRDHVVRL
jgi:transposase